MSLDISELLKNWPYEPGQVTASRIRGDDGKDKIQLRLDLGIYQMEVAGRPDGQRPYECESLLEHFQNELAVYRRKHGTDEGFAVDDRNCELLRAEASMYYHRYLAMFILEDFDAVERDTMHNIGVMDFCAAFAGSEADRAQMEQYRPYVLMMHTRSQALKAYRGRSVRAALYAVRTGMQRIREFYRQGGMEKHAVEQTSELVILGAMAREIESRLPVDPTARIRQDLKRAVREERYEDAAQLRDRLKEFRQKSAAKSSVVSSEDDESNADKEP